MNFFEKIKQESKLGKLCPSCRSKLSDSEICTHCGFCKGVIETLHAESHVRTTNGSGGNKKVLALRNYTDEERKEYRRKKAIQEWITKLEGLIP